MSTTTEPTHRVTAPDDTGSKHVDGARLKALAARVTTASTHPESCPADRYSLRVSRTLGFHPAVPFTSTRATGSCQVN